MMQEINITLSDETPVENQTIEVTHSKIQEGMILDIQRMNMAEISYEVDLSKKCEHGVSFRLMDEKAIFHALKENGEIDETAPILEAEWESLGEFRVFASADSSESKEPEKPNPENPENPEEPEESKENPYAYKKPTMEFVWGWALYPEDERFRFSREVMENLPTELDGLKHTWLRFSEPMTIEILKAFAFKTERFEFIREMQNVEAGVYGIFCFRNVKWY